MKKKLSLLILFSFLISMAATAQIYQDWKWLHPTPQGNTLRWVKMWDANNWYAIGYAGTFMKTSNAGANWTVHHKAGGQYLAYTGQRVNLYTAYFINQNTGMIGGSGSVNGGFARTTDGGTTWDTAYSSLFTSGIVYNFMFINSTTGYMVGSITPKMFKTTDGGITWTGNTAVGTSTLYDVYAWDANNIAVVTTSGNFKKSTDGGATWSSTISTGNTSVCYKMEFVNANTGYVTGTSGKFAFTTNGGSNWTLASNTGSTSTMYDLDIIATSGSASTKLNEGFESTTFPPAGWSAVNVLGTNVWERSVTQFNSGIASASITYQSTGGDDWLISKKITGISTGDSLSFWWKNAFSSAYPPDSIQIKVSTTDSLIASFTNNILSINGATTPYTWTRYAVSLGAFAGQNIYIAFRQFNTDGNGGYLDDVVVQGMSPAGYNVYLTGDAFYVYKTSNNGTSFDTLGFLHPNQPWTSTQYSASFSSTGDTMLTCGATGMLNRRLSASNTQTFSTWLRPGTLYDIWAQSGTGLVMAVGTRGSSTASVDQVVRSTNGGQNWTFGNFTNNPTASFYSIWMVDNNTGWICGTLSSVYKTTNGGVNWDSVATPFGTGSYTLSRVQFLNANTGWVFSRTLVSTDSSNVIKTTNGGTSWVKGKVVGGTGLATYIYWAEMLDANTGYGVNYTPNPIKTTDGGLTWVIQTKVDTYTGTLYGCDMIDANTGYICGGSGRIYKTTNGGTLWDTIPNRPGGTSPTWYSVKFLNANTGVLVGSNGMVITTTNGGTNWTTDNTAGSTLYNVHYTPNGTFIAGTSSYIFKNNTLFSGVENNLTEIPNDYELAQNYPNPFNPATTIKFALPKAGLVTMKIYDMLGREVMRAINNQSFNAGWNQFIFDGSKLSSGVYFYSLVIDNKVVDTKRMVLLK